MHDFGYLFERFWWLVFPLSGLLFGMFGMVAGVMAQNQRHRQAMEVMKMYTEQGKEPPPEVLAALSGAHAAFTPPGAPPPPYPNPYVSPYAGYYPWAYRRWWRYGPYGMWSRVMLFTALAVGFGMADGRFGDPEANHAFSIVAAIMTVLAIGFGLMAIVQTIAMRNAPKP